MLTMIVGLSEVNAIWTPSEASLRTGVAPSGKSSSHGQLKFRFAFYLINSVFGFIARNAKYRMISRAEAHAEYPNQSRNAFLKHIGKAKS